MNKEKAVEFVRVWQKSSTAAEVASKTGLTVTQVATTARAMRKRGVPLKPYGKSTTALTQLDWEELIALCEAPRVSVPAKAGAK